MRLTFAIILIVCLLVIPSVQAQDDAPAPYLYYYSDFLRAFVIERADGTDSRVFAADVMPDNHTLIDGPGWSPSGEWFAWTSAENLGYGVSNSAGWIMRADGSERLTWLDEAVDVVSMAWSPTEDLLAVIDAGSYTGEHPDDTFYLIDVANNDLIAKFTIDAEWANSNIDPVNWTPDGQYVAFVFTKYYYDVPDSPVRKRTFLRSVSRDGVVADQEIETYILQYTGGLFSSRSYNDRQIFSRTGWLLYRLPGEPDLIAENRVTGKKIVFPSPQIGGLLEWSAGDGYALLLNKSLWLLSVEDESFTYVMDGVKYSDFWYAIYDQFLGPWSPTDDIAAIQTEDEQLYLLDAQTGELTAVSGINNVHSFQWMPDGGHLWIFTGDKYAYLYNLAEQTFTPVRNDPFDRFGSLGFFSPDGQHVAIQYRWPWVMDLEAKAVTEIMPYSGAPVSITHAYRWSPDSQWLISAEDMTFAGGGGGPTGSSVFRTDGTAHRELTRSWFSDAGVGWLPENVIPHLAPGSAEPVIEQPVLTLRHDNFVDGVAWSPDGTRLVSHVDIDYGRDGALYIWEIGGGRGQIVKKMGPEICGEQPRPCDLSWSPDGRLIGVDRSRTEYPDVAQIWDVATGEPEAKLSKSYVMWNPDNSYTSHDDDRWYSSDGSLVAQAVGHSTYEVRDAQTGELRFLLPDVWGYTLTGSPTGNRIAAAGAYDSINLWDTATGRMIELESEPTRHPWDFTFSPDGRFLVWSSWYDYIYIYDTTTGELVKRLNWHAKAVDFSPDGTRLAAGGTQAVTIWDVSDLSE